MEKEDLKLKLANLNHDVSCLISAICNAKKTGKFEFKNLFLKEISIERLLTSSSDEAKKVHFSNNASTLYTELKNEIKHKDDIINKLELELRAARGEYNALSHGVSLSAKYFFLYVF